MTQAPPIPYNLSYLSGKEQDYIAETLRSREFSGNLRFTKRCEALMQEAFGAARVLLTTSCTSALEMAAMILNLKPGDEVIVPSFTFTSSANAFYRFGIRPVFVDIRADTLTIDTSLLEQAVTDRTRAVVAVHYAGVAADMQAIAAFAGRHGIAVIEDAAQGVGARYRGQALGTFGDLGTYSFHETKNITCGEGGALLIRDAAHVERAEIIREKGTNRSQFYQGKVDKYTWVGSGSAYLMPETSAAFLLAQLESMAFITERRSACYRHYYEALRPLAQEGLITLPVIPPECESNYHIFHFIVKTPQVRMNMLSHMQKQGIGATFHYQALHATPVGKSLGYREGMCPHAEHAADTIVRLPLYPDMTEQGLERVVAAVYAFYGVKAAERAA